MESTCIGNLPVNSDCLSGSHEDWRWVFRSLLWHCWLGERKGFSLVHIQCHRFREVLSWSVWRKRTSWDMWQTQDNSCWSLWVSQCHYVMISFLVQKHPSAYPKLCWKGIRVSPKIRVLPSRTFCQTRDLENFTTACQSSQVLST